MATGIVVSDANGQPLAYTYFWRDENEVRQANVLTHDEARRIAASIAKLPKLASFAHRNGTGRRYPTFSGGICPE